MHADSMLNRRGGSSVSILSTWASELVGLQEALVSTVAVYEDSHSGRLEMR